MKNTYYDVFKISPSATAEEIKAAYHKWALKYHPDRNQDKKFSDSKMKEINFIYSILANPDKRKWYDSTISLGGDYEEEKDYSYSYSFIFCDEIEVIDSKGLKSKLKVGQNIYYLVEIDKSIITWKYKRKEYFDLVIKNIFDPNQKEYFAKAVKFDVNKTPLCTAHWGNSEMIIYKEDFEKYWIVQESYSKMDKRKGIFTSIVISILFCFGVYYFYSKFSISTEKAEYLKQKIEKNEMYLQKSNKYYQEEYYATEAEVNYILSDFYTTCTKETAKVKSDVAVLNVPAKLGIEKGRISEGKNVVILLYCSKQNGYKVKYNELIGWVPGSALENPNCRTESEDTEK